MPAAVLLCVSACVVTPCLINFISPLQWCGVVGKAIGQSRLFYLLPHLDVIRDGGILSGGGGG